VYATSQRYIWTVPCNPAQPEAQMGRILIGVVIGVILVIWLLASCVNALF
jgi:hypothetical protein